MNHEDEQTGGGHNPMPQESHDLGVAYEMVSGRPINLEEFVGKALEKVEIELERLPKLIPTDPVVRDTECRGLAEVLRAGRSSELDRHRPHELVITRIAEEVRALRIRDPFAPRNPLVNQLLGREQTEADFDRQVELPQASR